MTEIAKAVIAGHEAKGNASIVQADDGSLKIKLTDFWIAPGAPDVRIVISPRKFRPFRTWKLETCLETCLKIIKRPVAFYKATGLYFNVLFSKYSIH